MTEKSPKRLQWHSNSGSHFKTLMTEKSPKRLQWHSNSGSLTSFELKCMFQTAYVGKCSKTANAK